VADRAAQQFFCNSFEGKNQKIDYRIKNLIICLPTGRQVRSLTKTRD